MAALGLEERGLLERGVRAVLGGWAALQLAVAEGFGGPQGPEKAAWLAGALQDFFIQNADLQPQEVEEFLAEVMDNEFDTAVEDGSLEQVSRELLAVFSWARGGDGGGVASALGALAQRGPALRRALANACAAGGGGPAPGQAPPAPGQAPPAPGQAPPTPGQAPPLEGGEEQEEESDDEEAMEVAPPPPDGWTLVQRRRR
ncbi:pre-rRNA-processing protein TSR2 homolog [Aegotheles albertisi]